MTAGDDQDSGEGGDEDLEAAQLLGAPIEVSWPPQVSQPLPEREIRNLPRSFLFTWYSAPVSKTDAVSVSTHHTYIDVI